MGWIDACHAEHTDGLMLLGDPRSIEGLSEPFPWPSSSPPSPEEESLLERLVERLPLIEVEVLHWAIQGEHQQITAERLNIAQSSVSIRLSRAITRCRWLLDHRALLDLDAIEVYQRLCDHPEITPPRAKLAALWWHFGSQTHAGQAVGWSQGRLRWQIDRHVIRPLREHPTPETEIIGATLIAMTAQQRLLARPGDPRPLPEEVRVALGLPSEST